MSYNSFKAFLKNKYILSGLVVRFVISLFFAHMFDFTTLTNHAREFYYYGTITYFVKWPWGLLAYLILLGSYFPTVIFPDYIFTFGQTFMLGEKFFLKLPLNISDLFVSYILYCIMIENNKKRWAMPLALLYWLNPLSILVSAIHGTFDALSIIFALLAFYHFIHEKYYLSALELGLGFSIKFQTLVLVPVFLILLWREARQKIPIFLLILAILFVFSFLLPAFVYYDPNTHYLTFTFSPSNLNTSYALPFREIIKNPNMSYLSLINRSNLHSALTGYNDIVSWTAFAGGFSVVTFLIFRKKLFEHYQNRVIFLAAYSTGIYMIFYLAYRVVHQHYALWVMPFLIILFAFGNLNRHLFITFNFLPLVQALHSRDTIFYYINQSYLSYGVNWAAGPAVGLLFSLTCLLIMQDLFRETLLKNYHSLKKLVSSFRELLNKKINMAFTLILIYVFFLIITAIYITGPPYWGTYPIIRNIPYEWFILPTVLQVVLSYILLFGIIPLALVFSLSSNNKTEEKIFRKEKWKYLSFFLLTAIVTVLVSVILQATLPYVDYSLFYDLIGLPKFFHGRVPVIGTLRILYEHGGFITTVFLLLACLLAIDILLPKILKNHIEYKVVNPNLKT